MVPVPSGNWEPFTASVAVAVPADPVQCGEDLVDRELLARH